MKSYGYVSFVGPHFSPSKAKVETGLLFTEEHEIGDLGKLGKYKSKPYDFGAASIDFECDETEFLVPYSMLKTLKVHKETLKRLGAEEIQIFLNIAYKNQCNLEFAPNFMKIIAELNVPLLMTCYEDEAS